MGLNALLHLSKQPGDVFAAKRARTAQVIAAIGGGLTVIIGIGFYYYINFYRTAFATSSTGVPLVDAGALLGLIVFIWQIVLGPRIRKSLKAIIGAGSSTPAQTSTLPKNYMLITPAILLILAFLLMLGGSMM